MPESTHVESDLHCIRCGHNLRTLAWEAKCGECGEAVERSRIPEHLNVHDLRSVLGLRMALLLFVLWIVLDRGLNITSEYLLRTAGDLGIEFLMQIRLIVGLPALIGLVPLGMLLLIAFRIRRRQYLMILASAAFMPGLLGLLSIESMHIWPSRATTTWIKVTNWIFSIEEAGRYLTAIFVLGWLSSLVNLQRCRFDRGALILAYATAGLWLLLEIVDALQLYIWRMGLFAIDTVIDWFVTSAPLLFGFVIVLLRRRIPVVPRCSNSK